MDEPYGVDAILLDWNFKTLASEKTEAEKFTGLLEAHAQGYTQRRRVLNGLKALKARVEEAERKVRIAQQVGKAKKADEEEQVLCETYSSADLHEKVQALNKVTQEMIDEGHITAQERPQVIRQLELRRLEAKAAEKAKLQEKLERSIASVSAAAQKGPPFSLPVANIQEIYAHRKTLQEMQQLEKRPLKTLDDEERDRLRSRPKVQAEANTLEGRSRQWFETEEEFRPRLEQSLIDLAQSLAEQERLEAEQALQRKRLAEEQALEAKRQEALRKADEQHKELMQKLEVRRQEAQAKPQKAVPQAKVKEKRTRTKLDPHELFVAPQQGAEEEEEEQEAPGASNHSEEAEAAKVEPPAAPAAPAAPPAPVAPVAKVPEKKREPKPPKPVIESKWGDPVVCPEFLKEETTDAGGPSLAEAALSKVKRSPLPQPVSKDKDKKSPWKMDPHEWYSPPEAQPADASEEDDLRALPETSLEAEAEAEPEEPLEAAAPRPKPVKVVLENKWDTGAPAPPTQQDEAPESAGPSLAEASAAAKAGGSKKAPPQPKKKEKKKFAKLDASQLGFDCDNKNY